MSEEFRQRSIRLRLSRMEQKPSDAPIPTGFVSLDHALGGGLPRGRIVELFGPSSSGKTTLALQVVARLRRSGSTAAWLDAEHSFDPAYDTLPLDFFVPTLREVLSREPRLERFGEDLPAGAAD